MNIRLSIIAAAALSIPLSVNAFETIGSDLKIHNRSTFELVSALHERGIDAENVEAWGDAIRVDAISETGRPYMVMLDKNTLHPLNDKAVEVSNTRMSPVSGFQWPVPAGAAPQSLVAESEGNGSSETSND